MRKNDLRQVSYEKYRLQWMLSHEKTLEDLRLALIESEEMIKDDGGKPNVEAAWELFEETGFDNRKLYSTYDEFLTHEFRDIDYMKSILNKEELDVWRVIRYAGLDDRFVEFSLTNDYSTYTLYTPNDTDLSIVDVSELVEYTLHSILDNEGSGRDVKRIMGFNKVKPEIYEELAESDGEYTITDLCFVADGYIERIWEEN